ncbi:hypothetical protein MRB53_000773 [Persea americana]|uniref:Uncharacterized protein n=1 Tax=Persea americana TaxID=3435 RepID=A0ACC2MQR6_PERAE|nr:hypothetical protein MRB53_000773 [Persea americana]
MAEKARNPSILLILVVLCLFSSGGFGLGAAAAARVSGFKAQLQHFKEMDSQKPLVFEEKTVEDKAMDSQRSFNVNFRGGGVPSPGVGH